MSDKSALRVMRELRQLEKSDQLAMTVQYDESNIRKVTALILGPPGTPYALGFYEFSLCFPENYPAAPPIVKILTTNWGKTRFGPNLYACGKVCLSILGTWPGEKGEEWSAAQGLESVLLSIQSLLSANPYINEPGFAEAKGPLHQPMMETYRSKIRHENLRLAVIAPLEKALGIQLQASAKTHKPVRGLPGQINPIQNPAPVSSEGHAPTTNEDCKGTHEPGPFDDFYKQRFLWYAELYKNDLEEAAGKDATREGTGFPLTMFEAPANGMAGRWEYGQLRQRMQHVLDKLLEETKRWPQEGLVLTKKDAGIAVSLQGQYEQVLSELRRRTESIVDLSLEGGNPFVWQLTYFGRPMTKLDGGILKIKIYISPRHPEEQPRVFVETPLFHVRVSKLGMLVYLAGRADEMGRHVEGILNALEDENPPYNPLMTVNPEASKLFWGDEEERRLYRRKLRRSVEDSVEYLDSKT